MRPAIFGLLILAAGCAKMGEPQPPFILVPEAVKDLSASQSGNSIVLTWTTPARNIDLSAATNLSHVQIRSGESSIASVPAGDPGQPQSYVIPIMPGNGSARTFNVIVDTKRGKTSKVSNTVSITPVEVPGKVTGLHFVFDQRHVALTWNRPLEHPELADGYVVTRADRPAESETVPETHYEDMRYQKGKTVAYQVTAIRRIDNRVVTGSGTETVDVTMVDTTKPQVPTGLDILESDDTAYLTWEANSETDLAGYKVYRSDRPDGSFKEVPPGGIIKPNQFTDPNYKHGTYYAVSAIDESGNESALSPAFRAP